MRRARRARRDDGWAQRPPQGRQGAACAGTCRCFRFAISALRDASGIERLSAISFDVREGEIVGIAGVAGNGQSELLEVLAGMRAATAAKSRSTASRSRRASAIPSACGERHVAHVPEDRQRVGPRHAVRGDRECHPRLSGRRDLRPGAVPRRRRHRARDAGAHDRLRRSPARSKPQGFASSPAAISRSSCWRARSSGTRSC